jgi:hypothetical protein
MRNAYDVALASADLLALAVGPVVVDRGEQRFVEQLGSRCIQACAT